MATLIGTLDTKIVQAQYTLITYPMLTKQQRNKEFLTRKRLAGKGRTNCRKNKTPKSNTPKWEKIDGRERDSK